MTAGYSLEGARSDCKSAALAAERMTVAPGVRVVSDFTFARELLRNSATKQATSANPEDADGDDPVFLPVLFLDGDPHRRKRETVAPCFTLKATSTRYRAIMEETTDTLLSRLQARGRGRLDKMSFDLSVTVAAEIIGLTDSNRTAMIRRVRANLIGLRLPHMNRWRRPAGELQTAFHGARFFSRDVRPAIRTRRAQRRDDVISRLLDEGYPDKAIFIDCRTYAIAGVITTREFIVMAAWHMLGNEALRERFLAGEEVDQTAILDEILRLEPVANMIARQATADIVTSSGSVTAGEIVVVDVRAANADEGGVGACPHVLNPDRARRVNVAGSYVSFGDGRHRCPAAHVALAETRIFLDRLLRIPGIRLHREPDLRWNDELVSYELRGAVVTCDRS